MRNDDIKYDWLTIHGQSDVFAVLFNISQV